MDTTTKHVFNIWAYAKELDAYLKRYYLGDEYPVQPLVMIKAMEELLLDLIQVLISDSRNPIMPKLALTEADAFDIYGKATMLDPLKVKSVLLETIHLDNLLTTIHDIVVVNEWDIWTVNSNFIENHGDFRILQWEREHIVEGRYVECPEKS